MAQKIHMEVTCMNMKSKYYERNKLIYMYDILRPSNEIRYTLRMRYDIYLVIKIFFLGGGDTVTRLILVSFYYKSLGCLYT